MKTIWPLSVFILAIFSIAAVIKRPSAIPKIKEIKNTQGKVYSTRFYLPDGRVSAVNRSRGDTLIYRYEGKYVFRSQIDKGYSKPSIDTFLLDDKGHVIQEYGYGRNRALPYVIVYDADGHQAYWKSMNGHQSIKTSTYVQGNLTRRMEYVISSDAVDTGVYIFDFTYYPGTRNTIGDENEGIFYEGKGSENLLMEESSIGGHEKTPRRFHHDYIFDEKGRVSMRITRFNENRPDTLVYVYY